MIAFYDKFNFMAQILINMLKTIKIKKKLLEISYCNHFFSIIIMTWLSCCKLFWWFCYADTKNIVCVWFHFLICINCSRPLFVLIILEVWLIVCLESRFLILFLFYFLFRGCNFTLLAIDFCSSNFTSSSPSSGGIGG